MTFKFEQEGPKTFSMLNLVTMLQGNSILGFSLESLSCLTVLFNLVLEVYMLPRRNSRSSLLFNFLFSFTIFVKEKLEDRSSIMIDDKKTKPCSSAPLQIFFIRSYDV